MQKLTIILILSSLLVNTNFVLQAKPLPNPFFGLKNVTKLHFYLQVITGGDKRTEWIVAKSNISDTLPSEFGAMYVVDSPITPDSEIKSGEIGRLQGVIAYSDFHVRSLSALFIVVFTRGEYRGSTLNIVGRIPLMNNVREIPIVGGTGAFRMASGYVISRTYYIDEARMREVYEYNAIIFSN